MTTKNASQTKPAAAAAAAKYTVLQIIATAAAVHFFKPSELGTVTRAALVAGGYKVTDDNKVSGTCNKVTKTSADSYLQGYAAVSGESKSVVYGTPVPGFYWDDGKPIQAGQILDSRGKGRAAVSK